jgi:hypothetical protein
MRQLNLQTHAKNVGEGGRLPQARTMMEEEDNGGGNARGMFLSHVTLNGSVGNQHHRLAHCEGDSCSQRQSKQERRRSREATELTASSHFAVTTGILSA